MRMFAGKPPRCDATDDVRLAGLAAGDSMSGVDSSCASQSTPVSLLASSSNTFTNSTADDLALVRGRSRPRSASRTAPRIDAE